MSDLGSLGSVKPEVEPITFDWFGSTVRANPAYSEAHLIDFMDAAASIEENSAMALPLVKNALRDAIHPDDFTAFWQAGKDQRQDSKDLMGVLYAVVGAVTNRPTSRPADSSGGPSVTTPRSAGDSSSLVEDLVAQGRPDLAQVVVMSERARAA